MDFTMEKLSIARKIFLVKSLNYNRIAVILEHRRGTVKSPTFENISN